MYRAPKWADADADARRPAEEERALSALDELNKSLAARSPCRINTLPLLRDFDLGPDFGEH